MGNRKDGALAEATAEMYDDHSVIVVGGTAAVPEVKLVGLDVEERLWGVDRLETMRAVVRWADEQRGTGDGIGDSAVQSGTGPQAARFITLPCGITRVTLEVSNIGDAELGSNVILTLSAAESDYHELLVNDIVHSRSWERNVRACPGEDGNSEPVYFEFDAAQGATWTVRLEELTF